MSDNNLISYVIILDSTTLNTQDVCNTVDKISQIVNWRVVLPNTIAIVSREQIKVIHELLLSALSPKFFLLVRVSGTVKNGWLPKTTWEFMNHPTSVFDD